MQADETALRLDGFGGGVWPKPSFEPCSSLGRIVRGGITELDAIKQQTVQEVKLETNHQQIKQTEPRYSKAKQESVRC